MHSDRVTLTVPARGEFAKTVRMTVSELASRLGMSYDDVDDMRIAAEEAFVYVCGRTVDAEIAFVADLAPGELKLEVGPFRAEEPEEDGEEAVDRYAVFILDSVCDDFSIEHDAGRTRLTLVKRPGDGRA